MARDLDTIKSELKTDNPTLKSGDRVFEEEEYNETMGSMHMGRSQVTGY